MKTKLYWHLLFELITIVFSMGVSFLLLIKISPIISQNLYQILFLFLFISTYYFLKAVFIDYGILHFFWVKFILLLANFPLFFYLIRTFQYNAQIFDGFDYKIEPNGISEIVTSVLLSQLFFIKNLFVFGGSFAIIVLVLFQIKMVVHIFKNQQVPTGLFGGNMER